MAKSQQREPLQTRQREFEAIKRGLLGREYGTATGTLVIDGFLTSEHLDAAIWVERLRDRVFALDGAPRGPRSLDPDREHGRVLRADTSVRDVNTKKRWEMVKAHVGKIGMSAIGAVVFENRAPVGHQQKLDLRSALGQVVGFCRQYGQSFVSQRISDSMRGVERASDKDHHSVIGLLYALVSNTRERQRFILVSDTLRISQTAWERVVKLIEDDCVPSLFRFKVSDREIVYVPTNSVLKFEVPQPKTD